MKQLFFLIISFVSLVASASQKMDLSCVTEYPSTSFFIREVDNTVIVEVFHHNGTGYMPIFDGLLTPNDVSMVNDQAQLLRKLPTSQRFEWPREKCESQGTMIFSCFGNTEEQIQNGHKVKGWSFYSSALSETNFVGSYKYYKLNLSLTIDGKTYSMPMKYGENECTQDVFNAQKKTADK